MTRVRRYTLEEQIEIFWGRVMPEPNSGCWLWCGGTTTPGGHGTTSLGNKRMGAHRAAWILTHGPIPETKPKTYVLHRCDNPACVNPDHLYLGTASDNDADWRERGASPCVAHLRDAHRDRMRRRQAMDPEAWRNKGHRRSDDLTIYPESVLRLKAGLEQ